MPFGEEETTATVSESVYLLREPSPCHACARKYQCDVEVESNEDLTNENDKKYIRKLESMIQANGLKNRAACQALEYEKSQHHETRQQLERLNCLLARCDKVFRAIRLQRRTASTDDRPLSEIVEEALDLF
jgi:CRISPR/Cas system CMR-associated protein Cmr5 small subunit